MKTNDFVFCLSLNYFSVKSEAFFRKPGDVLKRSGEQFDFCFLSRCESCVGALVLAPRPPVFGLMSVCCALTLLLGRVAPAGQPRGLQHTPARLPGALVRLGADHFPGLFQIQQVADREVLFGLQVVQVRRDRTLQAV